MIFSLGYPTNMISIGKVEASVRFWMIVSIQISPLHYINPIKGKSGFVVNCLLTKKTKKIQFRACAIWKRFCPSLPLRGGSVVIHILGHSFWPGEWGVSSFIQLERYLRGRMGRKLVRWWFRGFQFGVCIELCDEALQFSCWVCSEFTAVCSLLFIRTNHRFLWLCCGAFYL